MTTENKYKLSIHDTHRLPYPNAVITAHKIDSSTDVLSFITHTGEELGSTLKTNAKGYLCDSDGTPIGDGVFVEDQAYVTATFRNGDSTSWVVRCESDVTVNDGVLYGKMINDDDDTSTEQKDNKITIDGIDYYKIFSANQSNDSQLDWNLMANAPSLNKWQERQQMMESLQFYAIVSSSDGVIYLNPYTKVLILKSFDDTNNVPTYPTTIRLILKSEYDESGNTRYGRVFTVHNMTKYQVEIGTITDDGFVFATYLPKGSAKVLSEEYPESQNNSTKDTDASSPHFIEVSGKTAVDEEYTTNTGSVGYFTTNSQNKPVLNLSNRTPDVLWNLDFTGLSTTSFNTSDKPCIKCLVSLNMEIDQPPREFTILYTGSIRPLRLEHGGNPIGIIPYNKVTKLLAWTDSDGNEHIHIIENSQKFSTEYLTLTVEGSLVGIPAGNMKYYLNLGNVAQAYVLNPLNLVCSSDVSELYRLEFTRSSYPVWVQLINDENMPGDLFCIPAKTSTVTGARVVVKNTCGVLQVIEKSWSDSYSEVTYADNTWKGSFDSYDVTADLSALYIRTDQIFAFDRGDHIQDLYLKFPVANNTTVFVRIKMPFYSSTIESGQTDTKLHISDSEDNNVQIQENPVLFHSRKMDEECFIAGGWILTGKLTKSSSGISFEKISVEPYT